MQSRLCGGSKWVFLTASACVGAASCRPSSAPAGPGPSGDVLRVYVSIPPQRYFVKRIGGANVDIGVLLSPGRSPHTFEPTPKQMVDLASARVFFRVGVPFEKQVAKKIEATLRDLVVVDTSRGIERLPAFASSDHGHGHGDGDATSHEHGQQDQHTWMSPRLVKIQGRTICDELSRLDPAHAAEYEANLAAFVEELDHLDADLADALAPLRGRAFLVYHPAYGYFAEAYGLRQVAIESFGKQPTAKQLADVIRQAVADDIKLIFVQPQFARGPALAVAEQIGAKVVDVDPLAEDYLENLRDFASKIRDALGETAGVSPDGDGSDGDS